MSLKPQKKGVQRARLDLQRELAHRRRERMHTDANENLKNAIMKQATRLDLLRELARRREHDGVRKHVKTAKMQSCND